MMLTTRDKLLAMLLPTILIVLGYGWSAYGKQKNLFRLREAIELEGKQAPALELVRAQETQVDLLSREIDRSQKTLKALQQQWGELAGKCASSDLRNDRINKLTGLLKRHNISLLDDAEADGGRIGRLPPAVEQLAQQLFEPAKNLKPQIRHLRMRGSYLDMLAVLQELNGPETLAIPVSLTMKAVIAKTQVREWTMLVWI